MSQQMITTIGMLAAILTTVSFLPQLIKVWVTRSAHDISLWMFSMFSVGVFAWVVYGFLIDSLPVIIANICTLGLAAGILILKIKFDYLDNR